MTLGKFRLSLCVVIVASVLHASAVAYTRPQFPLPSAGPNLAGQFLVASRRMVEPSFAQSVIYVVTHNETGAMGLVINRVYGTTTLKELLAAFGTKTDDQRLIKLHYGGPVEVGRGFVLHSGDYVGASTQVMSNALSLSIGRDVMEAAAKGRGPKRILFLVGYCGWAPGQLESELARSDWLTAPVDEKLIFSDDTQGVWEQALKHAGMPL